MKIMVLQTEYTRSAISKLHNDPIFSAPPLKRFIEKI